MIELLNRYSPIPLTEEQKNKLQAVQEALMETNKVLNLTAIREEKEVTLLHFVDSLYALTTGQVRGKVLDVGTGGGFPAFPVAVCTDCEVTALDATEKKLRFIRATAEALGITRLHTLCGRAEELAKNGQALRESFDTVLSRGVARMNVLCEWCLPFVRPGGVFIAMKGKDGMTELEEALHALEVLGGAVEDTQTYEIPETGHTHTLLVIRKTSHTPPDYPRHNSRITNKPL